MQRASLSKKWFSNYFNVNKHDINFLVGKGLICPKKGSYFRTTRFLTKTSGTLKKLHTDVGKPMQES